MTRDELLREAEEIANIEGLAVDSDEFHGLMLRAILCILLAKEKGEPTEEVKVVETKVEAKADATVILTTDEISNIRRWWEDYTATWVTE